MYGREDNLKDASIGSVKSLLGKAIMLYQQAFDFTDYRAAFLGFWQVLETLTLNEPGDGRTQVDKRIISLLNLHGDEVLSKTLNSLMSSRNTLVHSGLFPEFTTDLVFTLKGIVDEVLMKILNLSNHLPTEMELREYHRLVTKNKKDLIRETTDMDLTRKVIEFLQNSRK